MKMQQQNHVPKNLGTYGFLILMGLFVLFPLVMTLSQSLMTVQQVNHHLLERGFLGGHDLSREAPALGQSMLLCVTEVHRQADIDALAVALADSIEASK